MGNDYKTYSRGGFSVNVYTRGMNRNMAKNGDEENRRRCISGFSGSGNTEKQMWGLSICHGGIKWTEMWRGWSIGKGEWERRVFMRMVKGVGKRGNEVKVGIRD